VHRRSASVAEVRRHRPARDTDDPRPGRAAPTRTGLAGLLTVYQTIIRICVDAVDAGPEARPDRISFTVALQTAGDQVIAAVGIIIPVGDRLVGVIGQAVLDDLLPAPRNRGKARTRKNPTSKYGPNAGTFPQTSLNYTINTNVTIIEQGLTARSKR
jgi:hypothetical protein